MKLFKHEPGSDEIRFDERTGTVWNAASRAACVREQSIDRGFTARYGLR